MDCSRAAVIQRRSDAAGYPRRPSFPVSCVIEHLSSQARISGGAAAKTAATSARKPGAHHLQTVSKQRKKHCIPTQQDTRNCVPVPRSQGTTPSHPPRIPITGIRAVLSVKPAGRRNAPTARPHTAIHYKHCSNRKQVRNHVATHIFGKISGETGHFAGGPVGMRHRQRPDSSGILPR
jgi:hypothetical protein